MLIVYWKLLIFFYRFVNWIYYGNNMNNFIWNGPWRIMFYSNCFSIKNFVPLYITPFEGKIIEPQTNTKSGKRTNKKI